jgi:hypothetical protein
MIAIPCGTTRTIHRQILGCEIAFSVNTLMKKFTWLGAFARFVGIVAWIAVFSLLLWGVHCRWDFTHHWDDADAAVGSPDLCIECHED